MHSNAMVSCMRNAGCTRRKFVEAKEHAPEAVEQALEFIGQLYQVEDRVREKI